MQQKAVKKPEKNSDPLHRKHNFPSRYKHTASTSVDINQVSRNLDLKSLEPNTDFFKE